MTMLHRFAASSPAILIAVVFLLAAPTLTYAATLQISLKGMDLQYDGSTIFDAGAANTTRAGDPAQADPLTAVDFYVNGSPAGPTLTADVFADIRIIGVSYIPVGGGFCMSTGPFPSFGFDLLTKNMIPGWGLALDIDSPVEIVYSPGSQMLTCSAMTSSITHQSLPYGLALGTPVNISFQCRLSEVTHDGQYLTSFRASGTGDVRGLVAPPIPIDPATWGILKQQFVK